MFSELEDSLIQAIEEAGFKEPTEVQEKTLVDALDGEDLFVSAETGSGKTAAYLLPTFDQIMHEEGGDILALVLVPTRELAQQVLKQAKQLARFTALKLGHIGGGTDIHKQTEIIQNPPHFIVATPGRLSELLARDLLDLSSVDILILDEADRLLDMGFSDEILSISEHCHQRRQTQLYSATLANKALRGLADQLLDEPKVYELNQTSDTHTSIDQQIIFADDNAHKYQLLCWLLRNETYRHSIVFCNSKEQVDQVYRVMQQQEISAGVLHGDKDQKQRNLVMSKMRRNELKVMVATDIAARGIDIEGMDLVINFEMPRRGEIYVHRIGRTGRAGEKGLAITLISAPEFNLMAGIERFLKQTFKRRKVKELEGHYKGPKKLKASGKAAGSKKKKKTSGKKTSAKKKSVKRKK
ncbi:MULTISPECIES: DEAD/DEAH box helicase [unclassified Oleiphilus]|nr:MULTISPECIES: DEAD/DEAH box helicase [unclassified Oleiphilus]